MNRLIDVLKAPHSLTSLSTEALSEIIAEARYYDMLAQLKYTCIKADIFDALPEPFKCHTNVGCYPSDNLTLRLEHEAEIIETVLGPLNINWIYLKGAAYHLAKFEEFKGRLMGDIDILVDEKHIPIVEIAFKKNGWMQKKITDYDEKFYREWSQEIPPMVHRQRLSELDIHFNILPKTLAASPDPLILMEQTISLNNENELKENSHIEEDMGAKILSSQAMVVHSAVHLFYESEFDKGVRNLFDLYLLFQKFAKNDHFWDDLINLQNKMGNGDSVFYALRYCRLFLELDVPKRVVDFYDNYQPDPIKLKLADFAFRRIFCNNFPPNHLTGHRIAEIMLYMRGHMKRMPMRLLVPHFINKTVKTYFVKDKDEEDATLI